MAADFQNLYSNLCGEAKGGSFGSKFVTVCVSGNEQNQVEMKGYQVFPLSHNAFCIMVWAFSARFVKLLLQCYLAPAQNVCLYSTSDGSPLSHRSLTSVWL